MPARSPVQLDQFIVALAHDKHRCGRRELAAHHLFNIFDDFVIVHTRLNLQLCVLYQLIDDATFIAPDTLIRAI